MGDYDDNEKDDDYYSEEDKEFDLERMRKETEELKRNGELRLEELKSAISAKKGKQEFTPTHDYGKFAIDTEHGVICVKRATAAVKTKGMGIAGKATLALFTGGLSLVAEKAMEAKPYYAPIASIRGFSVLVDGSEVTTGSFGGGSMTFGGQSNFSMSGMIGNFVSDKQKYVDTLALKIDFNDLDMPTTVITYISKRTKTSSRDYRKAEGELMNAVGALEIILNQERATW